MEPVRQTRPRHRCAANNLAMKLSRKILETNTSDRATMLTAEQFRPNESSGQNQKLKEFFSPAVSNILTNSMPMPSP